MTRMFRLFGAIVLVVSLMVALTAQVSAASATVSVGSCAFDVVPDGRSYRMVLQDNCTTHESIVVPDTWTLDGNGYNITVRDPQGDHFRGGVIEVHSGAGVVRDVGIYANDLISACDSGDDRLRGVWFKDSSGSISGVHVLALNQGASGCQEGNAIEASSFGGDSHNVTIEQNVVENWQKTGILVNGNVHATLHRNEVGESATQQNLAANSVQFGFGARGNVTYNDIRGNQWYGPSDFAATGLLLYDTGGVNFRYNTINYPPTEGGNSDIAVYLYSSAGDIVRNNTIFDNGTDYGHYDIGVYNCRSAFVDEWSNGSIRGFDIPYQECPDPRFSIQTLSAGGEQQEEVVAPSPFI